jgi:hypothetical protein
MDPGRVLYIAGENPLDIRMRWLAMSQEHDFDVSTIDVHFIDGVIKLSEMRERIRAEIQQIGDVSLIIIDTNSGQRHLRQRPGPQSGAHAAYFHHDAGAPCRRCRMPSDQECSAGQPPADRRWQFP